MGESEHEPSGNRRSGATAAAIAVRHRTRNRGTRCERTSLPGYASLVTEDMSAPRQRWRYTAGWWSVTLAMQCGFLFLTFVRPVDFYIAFSSWAVEPFVTVMIAVVALSFLLRTDAPWFFFGITAACAIGFAYGFEPRASLIGLLFALIVSGSAAFSVAPWRRALLVAILTYVAFAAGIAISRGISILHLVPMLMAAAMTISLFAGQMTYARRQLIESTKRRAEEAEQTREALAATKVAEQRLATARDLHDVVGHQIAVINLHAGAARRAVLDAPEEALNSLAIIEQSAASVLTEIGELLRDLRDGRVDDVEGISHTGELLPRLVDTLVAGGLPVEFEVDSDLPKLSRQVDAAVYRILEEALVNAYKYGLSGSPARVRVEWDGHDVQLHVSNPTDGRPSRASTGLGLKGIMERAESLGGRATATAGPRDFELRVNIPLDTR